MNKNLVIVILAVMLVLGSLWGQVGNQSKKEILQEQEVTIAKLSKIEAEAGKTHAALLAKTANLQKVLQTKEQQLAKARQELVELRKSGKALEVQISERDAALATLNQEKNKLLGQVTKMKKSLDTVVGSGKQQVVALQRQVVGLQATLKDKEKQLIAATKAIKQTSVEQGVENTKEQQEKLFKAEEAALRSQRKLVQLSREYESVSAQIIGLEKIVEEKNATIEEASKELARWNINMSVLLNKISEQQDSQRELREENLELVKELAAKNEALVDLNEQLIQTPVK